MPVTPGDVSRFLRDFPAYNILLDEVQFSDEDVEAAIRFAIHEYNATPPFAATANVDDPDKFPNEWLLLLGAAAHLMTSEAFLQLRNQVTYSDGNITVGVDDKWQAYTNLRNSLKAEWKNAVEKFKQSKNMEGAYDSLSSGYRWLRTRYH